MFIDVDSLDYINTHSDEGYSNHIKWYTSGSHNEAHRYNDARAYVRSKCSIPTSSASCSTLQTAKDCLQGRLNSAVSMGTGSSGARRVRNRAIKAANSYLTPVKNWYNVGQCGTVLTTQVPGCTDPTATNYNTNANSDDGSCFWPSTVVYGCTDVNATNYNNNATNNDGTCLYPAVYGCTDSNANNYNPNATTNDGSCNYDPFVIPVAGCTNGMASNFNPNANQDDGTCVFPPAIVYGCTDPTATNHNPSATNDDGLCQYPAIPTTVYGCTDPLAQNFNVNATNDDGSCVAPTTDTTVYGCTDPLAQNYKLNATKDDGSCKTSSASSEPGVESEVDIEPGILSGVLEKDNTMMYVLGGLALLLVIKMMK